MAAEPRPADKVLLALVINFSEVDRFYTTDLVIAAGMGLDVVRSASGHVTTS